MIKKALRYPGGKSRAVKKLPLMPNFDAFREPFVGGGSAFIAARQHYPHATFWINDLYENLYHFWLNLRNKNEALCEGVEEIKNTEQDGRALHKRLLAETGETSLEQAIRFFVLNRITFSGTGAFYGVIY